MLKGIGSLHEPAALRGWVRRIAVREALRLARARRDPVLLDRLPDPFGAGVGLVDSGWARWEPTEEPIIRPGVECLVGVYAGSQVVRYPDGCGVHFVTCVFAYRARGGRLTGSEEGLE